MTASTPAMTSWQMAMSHTSPTIRSTALRTVSRFSLFPVKKLPNTLTRSPLLTSISTTCEPIKPAPPVTRYCLIAFLFLRSTLLRSACELLQLAKGDSLEPRRRDCFSDRGADKRLEFLLVFVIRHRAVQLCAPPRSRMTVNFGHSLRDAR